MISVSYLILGLGISSLISVTGSTTWANFYKPTGLQTQWKRNFTNIANCSIAKVEMTSGLNVNLQPPGRKHISHYAWVEANTQWMNFEGCYWEYINQSEPLELASNTAFSEVACLLHCNYTAFVTVRHKCFCLNQTHTYRTHACYTRVNDFPFATESINHMHTCPGKVKNETQCHCMCIYKPFPLRETDGLGNCKTVMYTGNNSEPRLHSENCDSEFPFITQSISDDFNVVKKRQTWLRAVAFSQIEGGSILHYDSLLKFSPNISRIVQLYTKYWIGTYRRKFKIPTESSYKCLAARVIKGNIKLGAVFCNKTLPVLCRTSISCHNLTRAGVVEHDVTLNCSGLYNANNTHEDFESSTTWFIPTVSLGAVTIFILFTCTCFLGCRKANKLKDETPYEYH